MESTKTEITSCDTQLGLSEEILNQAHLVQNGQNQLIVFLSGDNPSPDLDQIRQAIFDSNRANGGQDTRIDGTEQLVPVVLDSQTGLDSRIQGDIRGCGGAGVSTSEHINGGVCDGDMDQFTCGKCKESFTNLILFLEHCVQHVSDMSSHSCYLCSAKLNRLAALKQHYRHKHGLASFMKPKQRSHLLSRRKGMARKLPQQPGGLPKSAGVLDGDSVNGASSSKALRSTNAAGMSNQDFTFILCTCEETNATTLKCLHCGCLVADKMDMVTHMKLLHYEHMGTSVLDKRGEENRSPDEHTMLMSKFIELTSNRVRNKKSTHWRDKEDRPGVYTCSKCNKVYGRLRNLRRHLATHRSERSFLCSICGRGFTTSTYLSIHRKRHKQKVFQCSQCDFTSTSNPAIHAHRQLHSHGSVLCDLCGYAYNDRATLQKHKEVHDMSRPFACTFPNCTWRFKTEIMCRAHIKAHTTEGKFKCNFCGYVFRQKHHLRRHEAKIHGVEMVKQGAAAVATKQIAAEIPIAMETDVDQLQLHLQQPQPIVVTTDNQGTPITYEASDISGLAYQTLLQNADTQVQETCAIFVDSVDGQIVFQNDA